MKLWGKGKKAFPRQEIGGKDYSGNKLDEKNRSTEDLRGKG